MWDIFRKYHYLNGSLNTSCRQFIGVIGDVIVCHTGVLPLPMHKNAKRLHRSVVLPDYQGVGIGMNFKKAVCDIIKKEGFNGKIFSTTTTPAQFHKQIESSDWKLIRYGRAKANASDRNGNVTKNISNSTSRNRITYTFEYNG